MVSRFLYPRAGSVPAGSFIGFIVLSLLGVPLWVSAGFLLLLSGLLISVAYPVGMDIRRRGRYAAGVGIGGQNGLCVVLRVNGKGSLKMTAATTPSQSKSQSSLKTGFAVFRLLFCVFRLLGLRYP